MKDKYNVCFVGLGSIANRHIKNMRYIFNSMGIECCIDVLRSGIGRGANEDTSNMIDNIYYDIQNVAPYYDAVFVTNPTAMHFDTIITFQNKTRAFFVEKPIFQSSSINIDTLDVDKALYYVACPLRYTEEIQYLKGILEEKNVRNVRVVSASYLPEWRPGVDYRNTYSANKSLGGGVSIDLIHEWDYVTFLFGMPKRTVSIIKKVSDLEIDSDDIASYIADYGDKIIEIHLDYFSREAIRKLEIETEQGNIIADLVEHKIVLENGKTIQFKNGRDDYQRKELLHFFNILEGKEDNDNGIINAIKILELAEGGQP